MATLTQPLRDEHKELFPHVETIRRVADSVGTASPESLRAGIAEVHDFLSHHLLPHAQAEESVLYPVVGRVLGAPEATGTMARDHVEIAGMTDELAELARQQGSSDLAGWQTALRRNLYGLYALVKVHFAKEEEVYLPVLDARLTQPEVDAMFAAMSSAAHEAMGHPETEPHQHHHH